MIAAVLMSITEWLEGTTTIDPVAVTSPGTSTVTGKSVNTFLNDATFTPQHASHTSAPPNIAFFGNPLDDECVADWKDPPSYPALYITIDGPAPFEPEIATKSRDALDVAITIRYIVNKAELHKGLRDWVYSADAILHSIRLWLADDTDGRAARTLLNKHIRNGESGAYGDWNEEVGNSIAVGVIAFNVYVRNNQP
jgi:hypothetical protein